LSWSAITSFVSLVVGFGTSGPILALATEISKAPEAHPSLTQREITMAIF
jgi:hypothetical protein